MTVIIPPKIVAKDSGIKNLEAGFPVFFAQSFTYGIINATIGVLFKNAERVETVTISRSKNALGFNRVLKSLPKISGPKIKRIPAVTRTSKKIRIICWFESPFKRSSGVMIPTKSKATVQIKKVKAGLKISLYKQ